MSDDSDDDNDGVRRTFGVLFRDDRGVSFRPRLGLSSCDVPDEDLGVNSTLPRLLLRLLRLSKLTARRRLPIVVRANDLIFSILSVRDCLLPLKLFIELTLELKNRGRFVEHTVHGQYVEKLVPGKWMIVGYWEMKDSWLLGNER